MTGNEVCKCGYLGGLLCDFPMGKGKTCDAVLCEDCRAKGLGDDWGLDFCRAHAVLRKAGAL